MTFAYLDTSALVKRYIQERGSARVITLLQRYDLLTSAITPVELFSALTRRRRSGDLSEDGFSRTASRLQSERLRWELVEIVETVLRRAEEIVQQTVPVRSLDAIHIASLTVFQAAAAMTVPFVTADERQAEAAKGAELNVIWIG